MEKRAVECGVHKSTLYRWLQRYKENATMSSLLPKSPGSAKGSRRIADSADRIITEIIEGRYLTRQRLSISLVQRDIALRCRCHFSYIGLFLMFGAEGKVALASK